MLLKFPRFSEPDFMETIARDRSPEHSRQDRQSGHKGERAALSAGVEDGKDNTQWVISAFQIVKDTLIPYKQSIDGEVKKKLDEIKRINEDIKIIQNAIQEIRRKAPKKDKKKSTFHAELDFNGAYKVLKDFGLLGKEKYIYYDSDKKIERISRDGGLEKVFAHLKMEIEKISSDSQLHTIKLNDKMRASNRVIELLMSLFDKIKKLLEAMISRAN